MINDPIYEPIFSDGNSYNMQFVVEYYYRTTKAVFVNSDIASEGYDLLETLSNDENFRFGFASASEVNIKFRLTADSETYINQANENGFFIFRLYAFTNNNLRIEKVSTDTVQVRDISDNTITPITDYDEFENGWYQKAESIVSADGRYINAKFYDAVKHLGDTVRVDSYYNMIYNQAESQTPVADVTSLDLFNAIETAFGLGHFTAGIQYTFNLPSTWTDFSDAVNSAVPIPRNITSNKIFARDLLNWIFELNGLVARVSRKTNGVQFDSGYNMYYCEVVIDVFPVDTTTADKSYNRYLQNQLKVEKERRISQVVCVDRNGTEYSASVGYADTTYQIDSSSNPMVVGMGSNLQTIANNLITVIGGATYTEIEFETYGDLCVEIGDIVEVTEATSGTTFKTIVNQRQLTGIHRMTDKISLKSSVGGSTSLGTSSAQDDKMDKVEPRGSGTFAMNDCIADGYYSVAVGKNNVITSGGAMSFASGGGNTVTGNHATAVGDRNSATGYAVFASGATNTVGGAMCGAIGQGNSIVSGVGATAFGMSLVGGGVGCSVVGRYNDLQTGDLFEVGNGGGAGSRLNAFEVKADGYAYWGTPKIDATSSTNGVSTNQYVGHYLQDKNRNIIGAFATTASPSGLITTDVYARNYDTAGTSVGANRLTLGIDKSGNQTVSVSDPTAWKNGIGVSWTLVGEQKSTTGLSGLSAVSISDSIVAKAIEFYVVVTFPASYQWQGFIDFVIRNPIDYGETWDNFPFMKGYFYSNNYNACIAVEPVLTGSNKRIRLKTGFSQVTNNGSAGTYTLTVFYR